MRSKGSKRYPYRDLLTHSVVWEKRHVVRRLSHLFRLSAASWVLTQTNVVLVTGSAVCP
jgi:hypothetical protein